MAPATRARWPRRLLAQLPALARRVGFQRRAPRKIAPSGFVRGLGALAVQGAASCRQLAAAVAADRGLCPSRQAVWARLTEGAVALLDGTLALALAHSSPWRQWGRRRRPFGRVLLQDSSVVQLPQRFQAEFGGVGNQHGRSCQARLQVVYDLLTERFVSFAITPYRVNDLKAAPALLAELRPADLVLRDMGYFVLATLQAIAAAKAFFLSRLPPGVGVFDPATGQPLPLLAALRRAGQADWPVRLGQQERLPARLIALPVPPAVAAERRRQRQA